MNEIKKNSIVTIREGVKSYDGKRIPELLYGINCYVIDVNGEMVTVGMDNHVIAVLKKSDLLLVKQSIEMT